MKLLRALAFGGAVVFALALRGGAAAELPKATQEMLKKLKLPAAFLADIDRELEVPKGWMEKARSEGKVRFMSTEEVAEAKTMLAPFRERYPSIDVEFINSTRPERVRVLVSYKSGKVTVDILDAITGSIDAFHEANALADVSDIPNLKKLPQEAGGIEGLEGLSVPTESGFRCIGYNTRLLKRADLPKKWDDLLTNSKLRGRNLALGNRPELWFINLWGTQGEGWAKDFLTRIFTEVKPQLRKEGMNALHQLVGAGEFHAFIPAGEDSTHMLAKEGAPIAFACPEPVPRTLRHLGIIKGTPNLHAAKVFVNWLISKEGQMGKLVGKVALPVREELVQRELIPWSDEIFGKKISWPPKKRLEVQARASAFWDDLWSRGVR